MVTKLTYLVRPLLCADLAHAGNELDLAIQLSFNISSRFGAVNMMLE